MPSPIAPSGNERIPLHSIFAKPAFYVFLGMHVLIILSLLTSALVDEEPGPVAMAVALPVGGLLLLWKMWGGGVRAPVSTRLLSSTVAREAGRYSHMQS